MYLFLIYIYKYIFIHINIYIYNYMYIDISKLYIYALYLNITPWMSIFWALCEDFCCVTTLFIPLAFLVNLSQFAGGSSPVLESQETWKVSGDISQSRIWGDLSSKTLQQIRKGWNLLSSGWSQLPWTNKWSCWDFRSSTLSWKGQGCKKDATKIKVQSLKPHQMQCMINKYTEQTILILPVVKVLRWGPSFVYINISNICIIVYIYTIIHTHIWERVHISIDIQ